MKTAILPTVTLALMTATSANAWEDCDVPIHNWKSRSAVVEFAERQGWKLSRIKIDDGCYEIYATDEAGRRFEAKIDPETFEILEIQRQHKHR